MPRLPIDDALPDLLKALRHGSRAVLQAPPGAGKTTKVPLALLSEPWAAEGTIVMLEPRRVAARAAAERMASLLGEPVGRTVGYRVRHESKVSAATRIEVVTEGILTRRLQSDPELSGVAAVLFDEFHERSVHADLGLALTLEAQGALREDLRILVMSATLDGEGVATLMDSPIVSSEGRAYPVETRWLDTPQKLNRPRDFEDAVAALTVRALEEEPGDALVFLPGAGEIRGVEGALKRRVAPTVHLRPIYGDLPFDKQQDALRPPPPGRRKVVLATAIAETSLTIEGVRIVIDAGRSRRARFDPRSGMSRLVTERVSKASAEQRRGRAGRTAPGVCYRLWTKGEEGAMAAFDPPEILEADLAPVALELAQWGAQPCDLPFLDPPPETTYAQAVALLQSLGALDGAGRITAHGQAMAVAPLHPRLAHMVLTAGASPPACRLATLLEERDPLRGMGGVGADMAKRMEAVARPQDYPIARPALERIRQNAERLRKRVKPSPSAADLSTGALLALAYPDRIGLRRKGDDARYLLSGGKGAMLANDDPLAIERLIVATDLDGDAREAKVWLAVPVSLGEIEALFENQIAWVSSCEWVKREGAVSARMRRMLGAIALDDRIWKDVPETELAAAMADGVRQLGLSALPWTKAAERFRARVALARRQQPDLPDLSDAGLVETLESWLPPHLSGMRKRQDLTSLDLSAILASTLSWEQTQALNRLAPPHFSAPTGTKVPIDYSGEQPRIAIRLQELFGLSEHPAIGGRPLLLDLLSPAQRPIQTTADLPGFWQGSYADVRKDMRAKYPKHPWPDDPRAAEPTRRAKRSGT
ncbi:MAG: ATP-dependent helicase HrpB [Pseudomonadota bacterium]